MERLQKIIAQSNIASRRKAEALILEGRVKVNGVVINTLGFKVNDDDIIAVDNEIIQQSKKRYMLFNKPSGVLSTYTDEKGRKGTETLFTIEEQNLRLYPVDKIDYTTSGLLLVTNDGELTKILTKQNVKIPKSYMIRTEGIIIKDKVRILRLGINTKNGFLKPIDVRIISLDKHLKTTLLSMTIDASNKDVHTLVESMGHKIKKITRTTFAGLSIDGVERGKYRELTIHEIKQLYAYKNK